MLVVLAIVAVGMTLGIPALQSFIVRSRTEGFAREIAVQMQRTRLEAIRMNREGAIFLDTARNELVSFIDADRDRSFTPGGGPFRTVDYELARLAPPPNVQFEDEADQLGLASIEGFTNVDGERWLLFRPDGSVEDIGALRVSDTRENTLEVRVAPAATARVELRKWQDGDWRTAGDPSEAGFEPWKWN